MNEKIKAKWFDDPDIIINVILLLSLIIVLVSQAMAVNSDLTGFLMVRNLFNHNFTYIAAIIYFVFLKTKVGRRNFNLITVFYIVLYVLNTVASVFTIFQSFSLSSIISFILNFLIVGYMCYTFLPDTRLWGDFNLNKLPFDEIKNDWFLYIIYIVSFFLLLINLIYAADFNGIVTTLLDTCFIFLFARYIYLYKNYIDSDKMKKIETETKKQLEENISKNKKDKKEDSKKGEDE